MNSATVRALLVRGMLAGIAAGLVAFVVAYLLGIPSVNASIAYEEAQAAASAGGGHSHEAGEEAFSRLQQTTAGLATGVVVFAVALGGIAALAYCFVLGRVGRFRARATAALVAGAGFVTVSLVPFLKYPANPPASTEDGTVDQRTALFFLMILLSVLLGTGAVLLGRRLAARLGNWNASVTAGAAFVAVIAVAMVFLPSVNETPKDFPAGVLWEFRLGAVAIQAALWASFGLLFGHLAERVLEPRPVTEAAASSVPVAAAR
ncbi:CbtA family protein [Streptomyces sp. MUM 203J]|uniref:CbtA family protein n=1 Tax=Streptomyces sp. MUM 203J TaxID=2791990 RepID=UPI001F03B103|nr:CbtA family protein [Streptomyces sp. MUM 203J]MCH0538915.1 CbtA family protein [Streptomyces sp. MUM 203J]